MKILVLGGHGFIGSAVAAVLERKGHDVATASRRDGANLMSYGSTIDCLDREQPAAIFHCAANSGSIQYVQKFAGRVLHDNVLMAVNLYRAVEEICPEAHIINPLSNCSYPGGLSLQDESKWLDDEPHHSVYAYGTAKRMLYALARCYSEQYGIRSSHFLVPNTFGVGDHLDPTRTHALSGMIVRMIQAKREARDTFEVWGSGRPVREWAYIDDVAEILTRALDITDSTLAYPVNIAQQGGYSVARSAGAIMGATGYRGEILFNRHYEDGDPVKILSDARFRAIFPDYQFADHEEAILRTVAYYEGALK